MIVGGIDGCRKGWLYIYYTEGRYAYKVIEHLSDLMDLKEKAARILIDMPIGLTTKTFTRTIEAKMRKELGRRSATVFNAPARAAVYAQSKAEARAINKEIIGKSLSEQSLNITPKIKELDTFITQIGNQIKFYESHPEICFKHLSGDIVVSKKATATGINERLSILRRYDARVDAVYDTILTRELRKHVKRDDIVDALCLCLVNLLAEENKLQHITDSNSIDDYGNQVGIAYFDPTIMK